MKARFFLIIVLALTSFTWAQKQAQGGAGRPSDVKGVVYDATEGVPIEYANLILFSQRDSSQITGTTSDKEGGFIFPKVRPGKYYLQVRFMGYANKTVSPVQIAPLGTSTRSSTKTTPRSSSSFTTCLLWTIS